MKKYNLITLCLSFTLCSYSFNIFAQPNNPTVIEVDPSPPNNYLFELSNTPPLHGDAAFYSYLWWMGDNGFSFTPTPTYTFQNSQIETQLLVSAIATGNYSTGGPPPIHKPFVPDTGTSSPLGLFANTNNNLLVQNYRNAIVHDTMYLLISYKIPNSFDPSVAYSGNISIDMTEYATIISPFDGANGSFTPNEELFDGDVRWTFDDLSQGDERTILVPIKILPNEEEHLNFDVHLNFDESNMEGNIQGVNYSSIETTVAKSHDPNQMIAHSDIITDCDYKGKPIRYTVQFQNEGDGITNYVKVVCVLDEKLDLSTIDKINVPKIYRGTYLNSLTQGPSYNLNQCNYTIDSSTNSITFEFHGLILLSPTDINCRNLNMTREEVSFSINLDSHHRFSPKITSIAEITFDSNAVITTNKTVVSCKNLLQGNKECWCYDYSASFIKKKCILILIAILLGIVGFIFILKRKKK